MMSQRFDARIVDKRNYAAKYQAVELPYRGDHARMLIVMPDEGTFDSFEESLNATSLQSFRDQLRESDTQLNMPKFEFSTELKLEQVLSSMGMTRAFQPKIADFSGMDGTRQLFLKHVIHKAWVNVHEKGTQAAAATAGTMEIVSSPEFIRIERPFIFFIYDKVHKNILFMGRVLDPSAS